MKTAPAVVPGVTSSGIECLIIAPTDKIKVQSIVSELVSKAKLEDQLIHRASSESRPGNSYRNRLIG